MVTETMYIFRKAITNDVEYIHKLINKFAAKDLMLPRSLSEIYENLRDYYVCVDNNIVIGCSSLHIYWKNLAELRSVAVDESYQGGSIATKLINLCLEEARSLDIKRIFVLTYVPDFFKRHGFHPISKEELPHKIWSECVRCHKFPDCNETPLILEL